MKKKKRIIQSMPNDKNEKGHRSKEQKMKKLIGLRSAFDATLPGQLVRPSKLKKAVSVEETYTSKIIISLNLIGLKKEAYVCVRIKRYHVVGLELRSGGQTR